MKSWKINITYSLLALFFLLIIVAMLFDQYNFFDWIFGSYEKKENFDLIGEVRKITRKIGEGIGQLEKFPRQIANLGTKIGDGFKKIPDEVTRIGSTIGNVGKQIGKGIENVANETARGVTKVGDEIVEVAEDIADIPPEVIDAVEKIANDIKDEVNERIDDIEDGFNSAVDGVKRGVNVAVEKIEDTGKSVVNEIADVMTDVFNAIKNFFVNTLGCLFTRLGLVLYYGIIKPIGQMFVGLGDVFIELYGILVMIVNKIISLPSCSTYYFTDSMGKALLAISKALVPAWLKDILRFIYNWIWIPFKKFVYWVLGWIIKGFNLLIGLIPGSNLSKVDPNDPFGFKKAKKKCYAFPVQEYVDNMREIFIRIGRNFEKAFGSMDWDSLGRCF